MKIDTCNKESTAVFLLKLAALGLILRFCIGVSCYNIFISALKAPLYAFDGEAYSIIGWYLALALKGINLFPVPLAFIPNDYSVIGGLHATIVQFNGALPPLSWYGVGLYSYIIGFFYYIFGYTPVLLRIFNSMISVAAAFLVYSAARNIFDEKVGCTAFAFAVFWPPAVIYSSSLQRDILINFLAMLVIQQILAFRKSSAGIFHALRWVMILAGLVLLYFLRINAAAILLVFVMLYAYLNLVYRFRYAMGTLTTLLLFMTPAGGLLLNYIKKKMVLMLNYHIGLTYVGGNFFRLLPSSYYDPELMRAGKMVPHISLGDCLIGYFNGIINFLFQPSPLGYYKPYHWTALPYALVWYFILLFALIGIYFAMKNITIGQIGFFVILFLFTSSIGMSEANVETLIRHRDMIMPVYIIFAAYGLQNICGMQDVRTHVP